MEKINKQSETLVTKPESDTGRRIVGTMLGIVEIMLAFRLFFKLLGANPNNGFVQGVYRVTQYVVGIFEGIFSRSATQGAETTAIFEPATLISMVVVALIGWGILKLMAPRTGTYVERTKTTDHDDQIKQ